MTVQRSGSPPPWGHRFKWVRPDELIEVLEADPALDEAFRRLTPGRQKSYVFNLESAKKPETRFSRLAKFRDKILAGKGATER